MAKYCSKHCKPVCDFCKYYKDYWTDGEFEGVGICIKKKIEVEASDFCISDFECFRIDIKSVFNKFKGGLE